MALKFDFGPARDPALALRIANCITGDIERMEQTVFRSQTDWKRLPTPFKASYAVLLVNKADTAQHAELLRILPSYEQNAINYAKDRNRRGRPLTHYEHEAGAKGEERAERVEYTPNYSPRGGKARPKNNRVEFDNKLPDNLPREPDHEQELDDAILEILTDPNGGANSVEEAMERIRAGAKQREQERQENEQQKQSQQQGEGEGEQDDNAEGQPTNSPPESNEGDEEQQESGGTPPPPSSLDEDRVREIAREEDAEVLKLMDGALTHMAEQLKAIRKSQTVIIERKTGEQVETIDLGMQHKQFPQLLKLCQLRNRDGFQYPVWLPGPAGSGKTTAARNVAKALDLPFQFTGAVDNPYQLIGFRDAGGHYHRTSFREAFEHGGVFLWDEVDASNPNGMTVFNAALENGVCAFPDGVVVRHKDCIMIAAANTYGHGATHEYVGRNKLDAATTDRFIILDWFYDEDLERALSSNAEWCTYVQNVRKAVGQAGIKHVVSPRASIRGSELLADGFDKEFCIKGLVRKGLPDDSWQTVVSRIASSLPGPQANTPISVRR